MKKILIALLVVSLFSLVGYVGKIQKAKEIYSKAKEIHTTIKPKYEEVKTKYDEHCHKNENDQKLWEKELCKNLKNTLGLD